MIRKIALATYAINFSQIANMLLTALVVPFVIGAEQYGLYAAIFAVPGFLQSTIESFAVLTLNKHRADGAFWRMFGICAAIALVISLAFYSVFFDLTAASWAVVLGAALLGRSVVSAMIYGNPNVAYVRVVIVAEAVTCVVYAAFLAGSFIVGGRNFALPIVMITGASVAASAYMLWELSRVPAPAEADRSSLSVFGRASIRALWAKSYEDLTITLMPLFLANSFGLTAAGEFRVVVSVMKMASKVFPFRYEVIVRNLQSGRFSLRSFVLTSLVFVGGGVLLAAGLYLARGHFFLAPDTSLWVVAFATGALVSSLAAFPLAAMYSWRAIAISTAASLVTYGAALWAPLPMFLTCFVAANLITYGVVVYTLASELPEGEAAPQMG